MNNREQTMLSNLWIYGLSCAVFISGLCLSQDSCTEGNKCVPPSKCNTTRSGLLYPCNNGRFLCCPSETKNSTTTSRFAAFPRECGLLTDTNKIIGGKNASIGQFPWMALLGYKTQGIDLIQFLCGGTLISASHVLTAAHCLAGGKLELSIVRLGDLDLTQDVDCEVLFNQTVCADPYIDVPVNKTVLHDAFNATTLKNDIALVRLSFKVEFTLYVRPICLPFSTSFPIEEDTKLTISGWGKLRVDDVGGSTYLQYAPIVTWPKNRCEEVLTPEVKPLGESQFCGNGEKAEDACKGDSGGPVFKQAIADLQLRHFQVGIISFGSGQTCGAIELPTVYTKIERYLTWIIDNAK